MTPYFIGLGGIAYAVASVVLGIVFVALAVRVCADHAKGARRTRRRGSCSASRSSICSCLFAVLLAEHAAARLGVREVLHTVELVMDGERE